MQNGRNRKWICVLMAVLLMLTGVLSACAPQAEEAVVEEPVAEVVAEAEEPAEAEAEEAAEAEEPAEAEAAEAIVPDEEAVLSIYIAYGAPELIAAEFEAASGIKVEFLTMSSGEVFTRLQAEAANPQTDIWFGGGSDAFIQAKELGLIAPYASPNAEAIDPAFKDADGYWTGLSLVTVGFLTNTERLESLGVEAPYNWSELADTGYLNELIASNPTTSGTAYTTVSGILQIMGEEAGWAFLDEMYANIPFLDKSGSGPGSKVLAGEFSVGIAPDPQNKVLRNPDAAVVAIFPEDGVLAWPSPIAMIAGAKHPNNARIFIDWALSPEGQQVLMQASPRVPTTNVETIEGVPSLDDLNLIPYDLQYWGAERERVIEQFIDRYPQYQ